LLGANLQFGDLERVVGSTLKFYIELFLLLILLLEGKGNRPGIVVRDFTDTRGIQVAGVFLSFRIGSDIGQSRIRLARAQFIDELKAGPSTPCRASQNAIA
jgi:hypothetical protein